MIFKTLAMSHLSKSNPIRVPGYGLVGLMGLIAAIYGSLLWQADDSAHLGMSALFGLAIGTMLWEKRHSFHAASHLFPLLLGSTLVLGGLIQPFIWHQPDWVRMMPLFCGIGVALMASGFQGIRLYWRELTILFFLMV
jgi:cyanoexosortase A